MARRAADSSTTANGGSSSGGSSNGGQSAGGSTAAAGQSAGGSANGGSSSSGGTATSSGGRANGGSSAGGASGGSGGTTGSAGAAGASATGQPYKGVANSACADLPKLNVSWWYNWNTGPGSCTVKEFVPMVSGKSTKTPESVASAITGIGNAGYKNVLGFNEPNKADQANMTVAQVITLWPSLTSNAGIRVGSAVTSADAMTWFSDFMAQVNSQSLRVDFVALHWYGWNAGSCDAKAATFENYLKWAEGVTGTRPIWITEWGCMNQSNPDKPTVEAFLTGAIAMLAKHPRVERYSWYPWNTNNELVNTDGTLTNLGTIYSNAPATK
ncbi:MAG: glycosyl hydrolase [Polyangiaceae bacterium]